MARAVVRRIGNSFGLILPKDLVREKRLRAGDEVDVTVEKAKTLADMWGMGRHLKLSADELNDLTNEGEDVG